tara:strand:+ start:5539 stop:6291 length:753 start_codon:yes stop_codon:yes gene_type:complete
MKKKILIITGGSKGIGAGIVKKFIKMDWYVLVGTRNTNNKNNLKSKKIKYSKIDVKNEKDHIKLYNIAKKWVGNVNCFINCAGFSKWKPIEKVDQLLWNEMIDVNLKGTFLGCKVSAKKLKKNTSIINISSLAGKRGSKNNSVYCISKFGVNGLTQSLAKELGPKGIRVNAVCPVYVKTSGLKKALLEKHSPTEGKDVDKYLSNFSKINSALNRLPNEKEISDLCYFLASDESSAITGQCINIDCGVLPQ